MTENYWQRQAQARLSRRGLLLWTGGAVTAALLGSMTVRRAGASNTVPDHRIAVRTELVEPKATDPGIDRAVEPHYVAYPRQPLRGRLFVFFHSTGNLTDDYQLIVDQAARNGFHAISLRYVSDGGIVSELCRGEGPDCPAGVRGEQVSGKDSSRQYEVSRTNSVENRLLKLLRYLHGQDSDAGWDSFMRDGSVVYGRLHVAGHSQGTNIAAYLARENVVARVALFAGPTDNLLGQWRRETVEPGAWLLGAQATPASHYYAFGHTRDASINLQAQWAAIRLGMERFGAAVNVDRSAPPYSGSHLLLTEAPNDPPRKPVVPNHGTTIRDDVTPKGLDGQPLFAPVWQYMCFS